MSIGFFFGIFIRHNDFSCMNTYSVYREVFVVLAIAVITNAFFFRPYEDIFRRGLCLPSDIKMTATEQQKVIDIIKRMF